MDDDATRDPPLWQPWRAIQRRRATLADEAAQYAHNPSFADHLPWVEYLEDEQCFLLDDNRSVGAVFELQPIGTEGREPEWLMAARDALEDALQDLNRDGILPGVRLNKPDGWMEMPASQQSRMILDRSVISIPQLISSE